MAWAIHVAEKLRIQRVAFWSATAASLSPVLSIQRLIDDGIIDSDGVPLHKNTFQLSPTMTPMSSAEFGWTCMGTLTTTKTIFKHSYGGQSLQCSTMAPLQLD
ncbi:hypothetical protein R6Q57_012986 [Mikania cordata]